MNSGKICVSVCAETADEMIGKIKRAEEFADVIEVRFDCLRPDHVGVLKSEISNLRSEKLMLATFRAPKQRGDSSGKLDERIDFWSHPQNGFWAADVEDDVVGLAAGWDNRIVSFHDFTGICDSLDIVYERLSSSNAEVIKIAVRSNDISDSIAVWNLLKRAKTEKKNVISIAMGEAGKWSRILGLAHGAFMTYASLDTGDETAPGQITAKDMIETYRVKELDLDTKVFGVIGNPVSESLSPYMHNAAFAEQGNNAVFIPLQVIDLDKFMRRMVEKNTREVELNFAGFSVTMPHKQAIIKHLDAIDPIAEKIGAVNTVKIDDGKLTGYNTDAFGFITPLKARFRDLKGARAAVFGAGGAARACVFALKQENANVTVFARDSKKAENFAEEFETNFAKISKAEDPRPKTDLSGFDIVVNATPLGMKGPLENESLFTAEQLDGVKFVYDLVTRPTDSPLIREAKKANIPAIGGLEMLIAQGAKQFEVWTGKTAPLDIMKEAVLKKMDHTKK